MRFFVLKREISTWTTKNNPIKIFHSGNWSVFKKTIKFNERFHGFTFSSFSKELNEAFAASPMFKYNFVCSKTANYVLVQHPKLTCIIEISWCLSVIWIFVMSSFYVSTSYGAPCKHSSCKFQNKLRCYFFPHTTFYLIHNLRVVSCSRTKHVPKRQRICDFHSYGSAETLFAVVIIIMFLLVLRAPTNCLLLVYSHLLASRVRIHTHCQPVNQEIISTLD